MSEAFDVEMEPTGTPRLKPPGQASPPPPPSGSGAPTDQGSQPTPSTTPGWTEKQAIGFAQSVFNGSCLYYGAEHMVTTEELEPLGAPLASLLDLVMPPPGEGGAPGIAIASVHVLGGFAALWMAPRRRAARALPTGPLARFMSQGKDRPPAQAAPAGWPPPQVPQRPPATPSSADGFRLTPDQVAVLDEAFPGMGI